MPDYGDDITEIPTAKLPKWVVFLLHHHKRIDVAEAHRIGLLHRVVPGESLLEEAERLARQILSASSPGHNSGLVGGEQGS